MARETIFAVEDDEDIQELISFNLAKNTFSVKTFGSGEEFFEHIQSEL